ncbi:unnamed protein product [Phytophthora lilii]|uniref:Unnamed protein product n=1 Tax=Phytophthora lilii TaxID=2077276 RepID=A0A9W6TIM9_9STRA|nr:unnamed protein product [Phytophthora lilii]
MNSITCIHIQTVGVKREPAKPVEVEGDAAPADPVKVGTTSTALSETARSPGPYRGKCLYQSRKCENERAIKRNGKPHNLCEEHRSKQNQHQRKFDAKKFLRKRRRESLSDEEVKSQTHTMQSHRNEQPATKHHRTEKNEIGSSNHLITNSKNSTPAVAAMRGTYPSVYAADTMPRSPPLVRLPPNQSPHGPMLPPSPAGVHPSSMTSEAYPQGHIAYSDYRSSQPAPHLIHRPYLQQQGTSAPPGYSHSELVAASILAQPQSSLPPPVPAPVSSPVYYKSDLLSAGIPRQAMSTPLVLPPLLVPPAVTMPPSPYNRGMPSSGPRFSHAAVVPAANVPVSPSRSVGSVLPPLVPLGLRRSSTSMPSPNSTSK